MGYSFWCLSYDFELLGGGYTKLLKLWLYKLLWGEVKMAVCSVQSSNGRALISG